MRSIKGNKKINLAKPQFDELTKGFERIVLDLGTGDGRYIYKKALQNPQNFYVGVDPSEKSLEEFSKKAVKQKLNNVLYVVGSLEIFPNELEQAADEIIINLPWGTLLQAIVRPSVETIDTFRKVLKPGGFLKIIFGYENNLEPNETKRLDLPEINEEYINKKIIPIFTENGFMKEKLTIINTEELKQIESSWGKRIAFTPERPLFMLIFLRGN